MHGKNVSITRVLTPAELNTLGAVDGTFAANQRKLAKRAREKAREKLQEKQGVTAVTTGEWYTTWTTDPMWARPKESTDKHNAERVRAFARAHWDIPVEDIDDGHTSRWLAGGRRNGQVPALRVFFYDAMRPEADRLTKVNPFARLGIAKTKGNKHKKPPTEIQRDLLLVKARELTTPSFEDYLETACLTGIRPSELDALEEGAIRWDDGEIDVVVQWNHKVGKFTAPKYGEYTAALTPQAYKVLRRALARRQEPRSAADAGFVFLTLRGTHYSPSSRLHHWNKVRVGAGMPRTTLYLATKHHFGWYAVNVAGLDPAIVAEQFGHKDGGVQVEQLYGHPDRRLRRARIRQAFEKLDAAPVLRIIEGGGAA